MLLGVGIEAAGVGALITALVALFGVAVKFLTAAAGTATDRFEAEITRLRTDKDEQIKQLLDRIARLEKERDSLLDQLMQRHQGGEGR